MNIEEYKKIDQDFSESVFLTKVNNIFVQMLHSIMFNRLLTVKHFFSDDVYTFCQNKILKANNQGCRQMYDEVNVKNSIIKNITINEYYAKIDVYLESRYMDYYISLETGDYVSGNNTSRNQVNYLLAFTKKMNSKSQNINRKCPSCGSSIDINASGLCEYCKSVYNLEDYDWILSELKELN